MSSPTEGAPAAPRTTLSQAKALAHPLRRRMLRRLVAGELSPIQLAGQLDEPPTKLYYHIKLLEEARLIQCTREEPKRGMRERFYRATTIAFESDVPPEAEESVEIFESALRAGQQEVRSRLDLERLAGSPGDAFLSVSTEVDADEAGLRELSEFLLGWIDRQQGKDRPTTYLSLASFPVQPLPPPE